MLRFTAPSSSCLFVLRPYLSRLNPSKYLTPKYITFYPNNLDESQQSFQTHSNHNMSPLNLSLDAPEFQILNSSSSVNDTSSLVTQLTSAVNEAINSNKSADDVEGLLWRLWNAVIATASRTEPESQEKLTQLLSAISQQEDLKDKEGKDVTVWEKRVWSDLPVFGAAVREIFNNGNSFVDMFSHGHVSLIVV